MSPDPKFLFLLLAWLSFGAASYGQPTPPPPSVAASAPAPRYDQLVRASRDAVASGRLRDGLLLTLAAIQLDDRRFEAYAVSALAMLKHREPGEARFFVAEALRRAPAAKSAGLLELQALVDKQALAACLRQVRIGAAHFRTNDFEGAAVLARQASALTTNRYEAQLLLALAAHRQGRETEAWVAARAAVELAPEAKKPGLRASLGTLAAVEPTASHTAEAEGNSQQSRGRGMERQYEKAKKGR